MARRKPELTFTGVTLDQWQSSVDNITWAQNTPQFKVMLSIVLNECRLAHQSASGCSEGRAFGRVEGYHMALEVLRSLGRKPDRTPPVLAESFDEASQNSFKEKETLD